MPIFLDSHHGAELPVDVIRRFLRSARSGTPDPRGVVPLDLYCGDDGRVFCIVAAPDEATVRQGHAAEGVVCRRVRPVPSFGSASNELNAEEKAVVRQMIEAEQETSLWHITEVGDGDGWLRQVG